jgi:threonine/homoserine/homoserine lactone efflux protein
MSVETWLSFVAACALITLIPGPCVLQVIAYALTRGRGAALLCVLGDLLGGLFLMLMSVIGLGAVLQASATLFLIVKWTGVLYVAYIGYRQIVDARSDTGEDMPDEARIGSKGAMGSLRAGFLASALNPKAIIFYLAFFSQFVDVDHGIVSQISILVATSTLVVGIVLSFYVILALRLKHALKGPVARRRLGYAGGGMLMGGSVLMAISR